MIAPFGRRRAEVSSVRASGSYSLLVADDPEGPVPSPGQFYMLSSSGSWACGERPYLPRAFSFATSEALGPSGARLGFLLDEVGPGTRRLGALTAGEGLELVGPLGKPFSPPSALAPGTEMAVLVGGGIGTAPLAALEKDLLAAGVPTAAALGFRDAAHSGGIDLFDGPTQLASDDGYMGHHGLVTELLREILESEKGPVALYACGPPPMLEAVRGICADSGTAAELAMESGMACGFGACFGCVVPTTSGFRRLCVDGPVVNAADLETALFEGAGH